MKLKNPPLKRNHSQITFSQHPAYIDVDHASASYSFVDAPNFDIERRSFLDTDSSPAFIVIVRLTQQLPTLRATKKKPCQVLDWHRIDHLICMGYREYLWVVYSPAGVKRCLNHTIKTWKRGGLLRLRLFSQELSERDLRLGSDLGYKEDFTGTDHLLTCPSPSFHIPEPQNQGIENPFRFSVSINNEEFSKVTKDNTVPEAWHELHTSLQRLETQAKGFGMHEESHHLSRTTGVLKRPDSTEAEMRLSSLMGQSDGNVFRTLFSSLAISQFNNHALRDIICSHMKKFFVRDSHMTKGTRRMVWTCVRRLPQRQLHWAMN